MTSLNDEYNPLADKSQIFEACFDNSFLKQSDPSNPCDLLKQYFHQFQWLSYNDTVLHCWTCQGAYDKYPSDIESDEWTTPNGFSYMPLNKDNLILILQLHNFSDNHIRASELLNEISETDDDEDYSVVTSSNDRSAQSNSVNSSLDFVHLSLNRNGLNRHSANMKLLRNFDLKHFDKFHKNVFPECVIDLVEDSNDYFDNVQTASYPYNTPRINNFNPWGRYLTRYPWLYLKDDNPGCKYCEQAFKLSLQMSFTKWTSPNMLAETVSQDRPNRTLLQHDRSKNHRIAEDVLVEHNVITPPRTSPQLKIDLASQEMPLEDATPMDEISQQSSYPPGFSVDRWDRFTKNYHWLYYRERLFHCTYCERAFEMHRSRMTHTSWTSSQFDSSRIKDIGKARHYFYDHQRSNNHRVAKNILETEGVISTKTSLAGDDNDLERMSISDEDSRVMDTELEMMRPLSPYDDSLDKVLNDKQWEQLCGKYSWLVGSMGRSYGCIVCQQGRAANPLTVNLSQWTQGQIQFTKTKYIQLRKSLWCHSITRNHINSAAAVLAVLGNGDGNVSNESLSYDAVM